MSLQSGCGMRTAVHPGTPHAMRAQSVMVETRPRLRVEVMAGHDLLTVIHHTLEALGAPGGSFILVGGEVAFLTLMTGGPGDRGLPMGFCGPHRLDGAVNIVAGAGGSGVDESGERFSHCHAAFRDAAGKLVGGHLIQGKTIAGSGGVAVDVVPFLDARFARHLDSETNFTIFHPEVA